MDGPTIVAAIAVVTSGVTSVVAPIIAGRMQRHSDAARFEHDRAMKDTDELRVLLDDLATALPVAIQKQGALRSKHNTSGKTDANEYMDEIGAFTSAREKVIHLHTRLILRLRREHPVTVACGEAVEAIDGTDVLAYITVDQPPPDDWMERTKNERAAMWAAHQRFLDVASEYVSAPVRSLTTTT